MEFGALARSGGIRSPPYVAFDRSDGGIVTTVGSRKVLEKLDRSVYSGHPRVGLGWVGLGWAGQGVQLRIRRMWATAKHVYYVRRDGGRGQS